MTDRSVLLESRVPKISEALRESRREQILQAALACFSRNGFHQTGMADIVSRSGLSHGAVYLYFQNKDEIIEALADDRHQREALLNSVSRQTGEPIEALRALFRAYAIWLVDPLGEPRRRVGVHGWAEALRSPGVHARVVEGIDAPRSLIVGLIEQAQRSGQVASDLRADAIARSFIALFQGLVLQVSWGEAIDVDSCIAVADRMLEGLGSPARPITARRA
jgi:AcrR family transcriptional regulator